MVRLRSTKRPRWPEMRDRLLTRVPRHFPTTEIVVAGADATPQASWHEGPAVNTVWEIIDAPDTWGVEVLALGTLEPPSGPEPSTLYVGRSYSELALAIGVVRFRASSARPYSSHREGHTEKLAALIDVDEPADVAFPIVAAVARGVVATDVEDIDAESTRASAHTADRLSARLEALGYEKLWNRAWAHVT